MIGVEFLGKYGGKCLDLIKKLSKDILLRASWWDRYEGEVLARTVP